MAIPDQEDRQGIKVFYRRQSILCSSFFPPLSVFPQALEESHLEAQREMKKKEHALKLALSASQAAKEEIDELRQKCSTSSKAAEVMTNKYQDDKIEVSLS